MPTILPARLKPGVSRESAVAAISAVEEDASTAIIRGRALIIWDLKVLGKKKKLDAIDTDQITPATDCVSESLETLDERWKAGAFRYLMPDFRARVHRGETFVIAGDRFAIGSSREMSPAGLKAIAEEVGLEMVVVCGDNMGDIFRRNALNLGLHVVQSPQAVADARDGDEFSFDPQSRLLTNNLNLVQAVRQLQGMVNPNGPRIVFLKKGEHGCLVGVGDDLFALPAYPTAKLTDPTGAGDSFAGGLLGYLASKDKYDSHTLKNAIAAGTVMASFTIEDFSLNRLRKATPEEIAGRLDAYKKMLTL